MSYIQAIKLEHQARKLRRSGSMAYLQLRQPPPVLSYPPPGWRPVFGDTVEGAALLKLDNQGLYAKVCGVYVGLPIERQHAMLSEPHPGGWFERWQSWEGLLLPVLSDDELNDAMEAITRRYGLVETA